MSWSSPTIRRQTEPWKSFTRLLIDRIRLLTGNRFFSPIYNFENALKQANGDIIALADQDDIWLADRLALIRQKLGRRPTGRR